MMREMKKTDSLLRANLFNHHFTTIHKTVPLTQPVSSNNDLLYAENLAKLSNITSFSIPFVTVDYVETQLKLLDTTKATGIDNINAKYLKLSVVVTAPVLTHIYITVALRRLCFLLHSKSQNSSQSIKRGQVRQNK